MQQMACGIGWVTWPLDASNIWIWEPGSEAEINFLCVLRESIEHVVTQAALLKLGNMPGGYSWGPGSKQSPVRGK